MYPTGADGGRNNADAALSLSLGVGGPPLLPPSSSPLVSPSSAASEDTALTLPSNPLGGGASSETEEELLHKSYTQLQDIRFASYRCAAKLRCLQKQSYLHHVDIWDGFYD